MKTKILSIICILFFTVTAFAQQIDAGRTNSSIDVSPTGAATYTIPIAVPPGINGVVPQIALSYNSQGGNGLAGWGWNVSGLSSITRIAATQFHDGFVGGINFDANDRFALDGQRLIAKNGVYGADGTEYQTENFSNIKIISKGTTRYGPAFFEVYYPDGSTAQYGVGNYFMSPIEYGISYAVNPLGLRIIYEYNINHETNIFSIAKISYGSTGTAPAINHINFIYKPRLRSEQAFVNGISFNRDEILSEISIVGNGVAYRNYVLTPEVVSTLKYQRLKNVQEFSGDKSRAFMPIVFNSTFIL